MENENVIGKVCFAILRKGFVAGLRISLELDSPGCIIGCKFDGAGIVGNTVIDDSDILLHITSHGIQTEKGHTTGDRSVFYIGVGAALKLSGRRKIENVSRAAGACAHFEPVGCLYITGCFQRKKRCCGDFRIMQRCGRLLCGGTFVVACPRIGRCACKQIGGDGNLYRCGGEIGNCTVAKVCIRTEATALGRVLSALLLGNNQTITHKHMAAQVDKAIARMEARNSFPTFPNDFYGALRKKDLVQVTKEIYRIQPRIFHNLKPIQEKSLLGFLNLLLSSEERENVLSIIDEIVQLSPKQREEFASVLKRTHLENIIATIRFIEDRYKVIEVLKTIVFDYAGYANERDHVQKIVEQHYWLFGEQYHLVTADKRMQKALEELSLIHI